MDSAIEKLKKKAIDKKGINAADAKKLYEIGTVKPFLLMAHANEIREHFKGKMINLCSIINAKSGVCPENCRFCAQSAHYHTDAPIYPLIATGEIVEQARMAREAGVHLFSIVTSGTRISDNKEWQVIYGAVEGINNLGIRSCASLGMLDVRDGNRPCQGRFIQVPPVTLRQPGAFLITSVQHMTTRRIFIPCA